MANKYKVQQTKLIPVKDEKFIPGHKYIVLKKLMRAPEETPARTEYIENVIFVADDKHNYMQDVFNERRNRYNREVYSWLDRVPVTVWPSECKEVVNIY